MNNRTKEEWEVIYMQAQIDKSRVIIPISMLFISLYLTHCFAEAVIPRFLLFARGAVILGVDWQRKLFSREKSMTIALASFILYYFPLSWVVTGDNIHLGLFLGALWSISTGWTVYEIAKIAVGS